MISQEDEVVGLETAKKLFELMPERFKESKWWWIFRRKIYDCDYNEWLLYRQEQKEEETEFISDDVRDVVYDFELEDSEMIPAPTAQEIWGIFPAGFFIDIEDALLMYYNAIKSKATNAKTIAEYFGEVAIWCFENGRIRKE